MKKEIFEAFEKAWKDFPSQDNEGYVPDRAGFKAGWFACWDYRQKQIDKMDEHYFSLGDVHNSVCKDFLSEIEKLKDKLNETENKVRNYEMREDLLTKEIIRTLAKFSTNNSL